MLGASNQSAKEVKIFGLGQYLADRSRKLFDRFYAENKALAVKRAASGSLLNLLPTAGYYAAYIVILIRTLAGALSLGSLTFLAGAFARSRSLIENLFSSLNNIAEQALYIKDLFDFFETKPSISSPPGALAPKLFMPMKTPRSPIQRSQPKRSAASTARRGAEPSTSAR